MWNKKLEKLCLNLCEKCDYQKILHDKATRFYFTFDTIISILAIIIQTASGTTIIATLTSTDNFSINITVGIILYLGAVMESIKKLINPSQKNILHSNSVKGYSNLSHNIQKQLALDQTQRQNSKDYLEWITREFDNLEMSTPDVPSFIIKKIKSPPDINLHEIILEKENHSMEENNITTFTDIQSNKTSEDNNKSVTSTKNFDQVKDSYILGRFKNIT